MRRSKLTGFFIILFCVFFAASSYSADAGKKKVAQTKQEITAKKELKKKINSLYRKALSLYFKNDLVESRQSFEAILALNSKEAKAKRYIDTKIPEKEKRNAERLAKKRKKLALRRGKKSVSKSKDKTQKAKDKKTFDASKDVEEITTIVTSGSLKEELDEKVRYLSTKSGWSYDPTVQKGIRFTFKTFADYDSNIYLSNTNREHDVITHFVPGIYGHYGTPSYLLYAFYDTDILVYGLNPKDTRLNQRIGTKLLLFRDRPIKLMISDTFQPTTAPATAEFTKWAKRMNNNLNGTVRYDISPKTSIACSYDQLLQHFVSATYEKYSYMRHTVNPVLYWHLSPKTSITGDYSLALTNYYEGQDIHAGFAGQNYDSQFHQIRVGVEGDITPKSKIFLRTGYQHRHYNDSRLKTADAWVFEGVYDWAVAPKTALNLVLSHDINESTFSDVGYYKSLNLYLNVTQRLFTCIDLTGRALYIRSDYPHARLTSDNLNKKRVDDLYGVGGQLAYRFGGWLSVFASYDYKNRWSNNADYKYVDNQFRWGVRTDF